MQRERRLTKGETPTAPTEKLNTSLPAAERFDSRRVRARRLIVRELDEWFGIFHYPDPSVIYAAAPSREAALDD
jgi:hypothetical protein